MIQTEVKGELETSESNEKQQDDRSSAHKSSNSLFPASSQLFCIKEGINFLNQYCTETPDPPPDTLA